MHHWSVQGVVAKGIAKRVCRCETSSRGGRWHWTVNEGSHGISRPGSCSFGCSVENGSWK
jgi:hypothetical protein